MAGTHEHHEEVVRRLKRARGHLDKVVSMIEEGRACLEVAQQLQAVHRAVGNAKALLVQDHVEHCLDPAALADLPTARKVIKELREISKYL